LKKYSKIMQILMIFSQGDPPEKIDFVDPPRQNLATARPGRYNTANCKNGVVGFLWNIFKWRVKHISVVFVNPKHVNALVNVKSMF